jgi:hypothetical protein
MIPNEVTILHQQTVFPHLAALVGALANATQVSQIKRHALMKTKTKTI